MPFVIRGDYDAKTRDNAYNKSYIVRLTLVQFFAFFFGDFPQKFDAKIFMDLVRREYDNGKTPYLDSRHR